MIYTVEYKSIPSFLWNAYEGNDNAYFWNCRGGTVDSHIYCKIGNTSIRYI